MSVMKRARVSVWVVNLQCLSWFPTLSSFPSTEVWAGFPHRRVHHGTNEGNPEHYQPKVLGSTPAPQVIDGLGLMTEKLMLDISLMLESTSRNK